MVGLWMYILGVISLYSSMNVISSKNSVNSVISLILVFIMLSIELILLGGDSLGLILIMVYVGAVSVLFLFVIMLLGNVDKENESVSIFKVVICVVMSNIVLMYSFKEDKIGKNSILGSSCNDMCNIYDMINNMDVIGVGLYVLNMYNVLLSGVMLLIAIVGGVVLGRNG